MKDDPRAELRGKWDIGGTWWCDCPARNPDTKRHCKPCGIYRPLKGSPVYELKDSLQGDGFMYKPRLVPIEEHTPNG